MKKGLTVLKISGVHSENPEVIGEEFVPLDEWSYRIGSYKNISRRV